MRNIYRIVGRVVGIILLVPGVVFSVFFWFSSPQLDWSHPLAVYYWLILFILGIALLGAGMLLVVATRGPGKRTRAGWFEIEQLSADASPLQIPVWARILLMLVGILAVTGGGHS